MSIGFGCEVERKLDEIDNLSEEDKNALILFIEALAAKNKLKNIVNSMK